ncbi:hypothetical protein DSM106972_030090 [Dulcicalothrix desertica PCC 7102]|uniref:HEAT repeat domain-containing protein n=1 Tax=Dulcicalothrix desertica PCC 7102 TaxID=232991 RepID=A0A3S1DBA9_9CYAN|nr:HEAT repeat domain-containing protein [Dulcicalothrix desertica]RUT06752.1 hypothetical protein DSM106972_030090 [Dulcicalothrix desertica PCC 7102]TWH50140.1 hypothetical protein CAL7102_04425 [Dulcicalothrix desertica PCC 7102]
MVNSTSYQPPIDKLLTLGSQHLNDVAELGIGSEHIPDLIKMAVDDELLGADNEKETMAPVHAWRILGQLQATDAIIPLIQLFKLVDNDLVNEELPKVYGNIGTAAIPALVEYLAQNQNQLLARVTAINSLEEIASQHPSASNQVKSVLTQSLQSCNQNEAELNGFIVSALINLQTQEAAPIIKYAFNTNQVAEDIVGNWDEVRQSLGINSDEEVQEFIPTPQHSVTEASTPDVEEASEDEINALIDLVAQVTETETQTKENAVPTSELASETENTSLLSNEPEVQQQIIDTEENLTNTIDKVEEEIEDVVSEIEASEDTQVAVEASTKTDEWHEQTKDESIETVIVESDEESNLLEQEDNKGFGRPATSKEKPEKPQKAKPSKKKKRGFSDL